MISMKKLAAGMMVASLGFFAVSCDDDDPITPDEPTGNELANGATLSGNITANTTLTRGNTYHLKGGVHVKPGATLFIQEGVTVKSDLDPSTAYLLVEPGAKIEAIGTASSPIVFTSGQANPLPQDWGGIILTGKAPINVTGGTASSEMGAGVTYGGTDPNDNSGTLKYVRVEYTGKKQTPEKEHNGFTFEGVGAGTTLEYLSSYRGGDDGIEFFGGTVNLKYAVVYGAQDDLFDWTYGWSGNGQFWLGVQEQSSSASFKAVGDRGFEADNNGSNNANTPWSNPTISNVTLVGSLTAATGDDPTTATATGNTRAMKLRAGTRGQLYNFVMYNFNKGVEVEHDVTLEGMAGEHMVLKNSDIYNASPWSYKKTSGDAWDGAKPFESAAYGNNVQGAGTPSYISNTFVGTSDAGAKATSELGSWFTSANYKGAVNSSNNWVGSWAKTN